MTNEHHQAVVRDATEADLPALTGLKETEALHRDRIRDADGEGLRYLVLVEGDFVIGHAVLVFVWPPGWPDPIENRKLPEVLDLAVAPELRSRGLGARFMREIEEICRDRGEPALHLAVDPVENPRALDFYLRIGYRKVSDEPRRVHWKFTDSEGNVHEGRDWNLDLVKELRLTPP